MSRLQQYIGELEDRFFDRGSLEIFPEGSREDLEGYLQSRSNLPGPRGNLELAEAFSRATEEAGFSNALGDLWCWWMGISEEKAPANDPREFLPFCSLLSMGAVFYNLTGRWKKTTLDWIRDAANDGRWRVREGAAMALQKIGEREPSGLQEILSGWMNSPSLLEQRAVVAALAHYPLLSQKDFVGFCLRISAAVLESVSRLDRGSRRSEGFRVLKKGLSYALSLFVEKDPENGFALMETWIRRDDPEIGRIMAENLKKNRLKRRYPEQIRHMGSLLEK